MNNGAFDLTDDLLQLFTEMLVGAVKCMIPDGLLTDEEKYTLDSIDPMLMDYDILYKKPINGHEPWGWAIYPSKIFYNRARGQRKLGWFRYGPASLRYIHSSTLPFSCCKSFLRGRCS